MDFSTNLYSDYVTGKVNQSSKVEHALQTSQNATDEELLEACKSFEAYFLEQVFTAMLDSTKAFSDESQDSYASKMVDYFKDTAIQSITEEATKQDGIGIAKQLFEQMKRQNNAINPASLQTNEDI